MCLLAHLRFQCLDLLTATWLTDEDVAVAGVVTSPPEGDTSLCSQRCFLSILDMCCLSLTAKIQNAAVKYSLKVQGLIPGTGALVVGSACTFTLLLANTIGTLAFGWSTMNLDATTSHNITKLFSWILTGVVTTWPEVSHPTPPQPAASSPSPSAPWFFPDFSWRLEEG